MFSNKYSTRYCNYLLFSKVFLWRGNALLLCLFLLFGSGLKSFADGSRELSLNGGYRAYLFSSNDGNTSFPFPTLGTMKVYVKSGETIYIGSSAQGIGAGTINLRAPDGSTYTSGNSATTGLIANRNQELAGPQPNAGGYKPFTQTIQAGQEGVWEIDFISAGNGVDQGSNPPVTLAAANWKQPVTGQFIAAFDVSVRNAGNTLFIPGRVFTNVFSGILGNFIAGFNGIFNILTKDGYRYTINNNGQAGNGFSFFVNNKGFRGANGAASYLSVDTINNPNVQDPRTADSQSDITQKIFFEPPAADLPAVANTPGGSTWLLNTPGVSSVSGINFTGTEGTEDKAGTNPLGGNFNFTSTGGGNYTIIIDVNKNGSFTDPIDRKLVGSINAGANAVHWDGLDGAGNKVVADTVTGYKASISITTTAGEVHFPFFDVERNINGIILTRLNGVDVPDNAVYWNDSPVTIIGTPSNPIKETIGINSLINGHKWGSPAPSPTNDADFGNNKGIDTWAYIPIPPVVSIVAFKLFEADLEIDSIKAVSGCTGQPITYVVSVKNNGPDDVNEAKFNFAFPADITNVSVKSLAVTGTAIISPGVVLASGYNAALSMSNGALVKFTISGMVSTTSGGNIAITASILRPADVTDPDATNPDAAVPSDPAIECNSEPSGIGCNNIQTLATLVPVTPNAGEDQTVFAFAVATITATGTGTWTQDITDPAIANINNASSQTTTVTGLVVPGAYHFINTNAGGCADTVVLNVISSNVIIPNVFTPNNDGKNDVFYIKGLESYPGSQLLIFNRWGNEVYRANNYMNNWNGSGLAEGTYFYLLNRKEHDGSTLVFKGWVFLKRTP